MADYPWYEVATGLILAQGDILSGCVAPLPPIALGDAPQAQVEESDQYEYVVVLSQSCDLENKKISRVLVCPAYDSTLWLEQQANPKDIRKKLASGSLVAHHLLDRSDIDGFVRGHLVTDFGDSFSVPFGYAEDLAADGPRLRLRPPYREHLAQAFARFHMRVGLPLPVSALP